MYIENNEILLKIKHLFNGQKIQIPIISLTYCEASFNRLRNLCNLRSKGQFIGKTSTIFVNLKWAYQINPI